jgi:hypothetical protein
MYQLTVTVGQVMDLWHVSGGVLERFENGTWEPIASFSDDFQLSDSWLTQDPVTTMVHVLRLWSEMTINK